MEEDSVSRDANIKYNLEVYLSYICECVDAIHLLQHIDCYSDDQRREISQLAKSNPVGATRKAFDILMQKELPGIFTALLESLQDDYPKIVKLLQGDVVKCDKNYRKIITLFSQSIVREIQPIELLLCLRKYNVLTEEEAEEARADERNFGLTRAAFNIVTNIHRHVEDWFKYFLMSLIEIDCENLAERLDQDLVEKIKAQKRFSSANEEDTFENETRDDIREHVQDDILEVPSSLKIENAPPPDTEADITKLKISNLECHGDQCEQEDSMNIAKNDLKEINNTQLLNVGLEDDDVTVLKQQFRRSNKEIEAVENTDEESPDEADDMDADLDFNDLDKSGSEADDSDDIYAQNIETDLDEITNPEEHEIELRGYQKKLAKKGCEGENVIIMAPTNSGKTKVACQIVLSMFKRCEEQKKKGKAVFVVEREDLAFQQGKVFEEELPSYRTKVVTGDVQQSKDQYLKDYVQRRDVFVVTAQVLLNYLKAKDIGSLDVFDIIVFDECHHTDKKHPYKKIMDNYFEQRLKNAIVKPQIVGLTASIGVGGKLDRNIAFENMKQIAANLDAEVLCIVDDEDDKAEMKGFIKNPDEKIVAVPKRATERFFEDILDAVEKIDTFMMKNPHVTKLEEDDKYMKTISRVPTRNVGKSQFQSWLSGFRHGLSVLKSDNARQILHPCLSYLDQYHIAVMLYNDARIKDALSSLKRFVDKRRQADYNNEADEFLLQLYDDLRSGSYKNEPENPKLLKLKELILETMRGDENARGIIFVKTRALARTLKLWMHETVELKKLNANAYLGKVVSTGEGGMSKHKQRNVLGLFKNGRHKIILATTVAEEGLDIAICNLVIKYEHVTNERARVQCRGRARAPNSKYYVLTEEGSDLIEKEKFNARCETLMQE
ncbi:ATP-dependent RNA helicase DHX58-like [Mercenaria mercenaria]|uniref:ATP-dependent RNA helicase DHX58-like n=1 Tax=Mercenaria mercenaria TaxID=6596 RepID=UPI00234EDD4B|nr:ATP-dependent RNA helicase DHX58-like [Mercenaria mercenaria]